jgi:hypothetical protein
MNDEGIKIESIKDITIKAAGNLKVEAVNAEVKASAQIKLKGDAGAEYSSGGTTAVKGSLVNIN